MNITAALVNELRQMTGAGMMDCKKALVETEGDIEKAIDLLRKKGIAKAAKRADRVAKEGAVFAKVADDHKFGAIIMVNCETDFVAKNADFVAFTKNLLDLAVANGIKTADELKEAKMGDLTVNDAITNQSAVTGEKIELGAYQVLESEYVTFYNHHGNSLATIVAMNKNFDKVEEISHEIALQIAAMAPISVDENDVPEETKQRELEIGMDQARQEGKPEAMVEKIALGKLNKFYRQSTLLNQDSLAVDGKSVRQYIQDADKDATVTAFVRLKLGE